MSKKTPAQQKRQNVTDDSGWTHVVKGPENSVSSQDVVRASRLGKVPQGLTPEKYSERFRKYYSHHWQESSCCAAVSRIIEQRILSLEHIAITNCVCLGLGSLTAGLDCSSYELAALVSILNILGQKHNIRETIFQDPVFNTLDQDFLCSLGYTVVAHPSALTHISTNTFLFAPHLEFSVYANALEDSDPALCIGSDMDAYVNRPYHHHAGSEETGVKQIFQCYVRRTESVAMPDFDRTPWCNSMRIYWVGPGGHSSGEADGRAIDGQQKGVGMKGCETNNK